MTPELIGDARKVAVSSSASTPEDLTQGVVEKLSKEPFNFSVDYFEGCDERVPKWRLPRFVLFRDCITFTQQPGEFH